MENELMTMEEIANYLRVSVPTIRLMLKEKRIPGSKIGKSWRFMKKEIDEWIMKRNIMKEEKTN